jgi:hypothetical protein
MSGLNIAGSGLTLVDPTSGGGINITQLARGDFSSSVTQSIANVSNPQACTFDTPVNTQGISLVASTKLTAAASGYYLLVWTAQAHITAGSNKNLWIWLRKNGTDVAYTAQNTQFNAGPPVYITGSNIVQLNANDYVELWMAGDSTNCQVQAQAASAGPPAYPASPSLQVTITQVG